MLLLVILNAAALVAAGVLAGMLRAYGSEKGKNLATKEDIEAITHKIEGVRIQYLTELERLRTDLARGLNVHKASFEIELLTYRQIWEKLIPVQHATFYLRPTVVFGPPPTGTPEEHKAKLLNTFAEAFNPFADLVYKTRPFYPESVYRELTKVIQLVYGESQEFRLYEPTKTPDYWDKAFENAEAITAQINTICDAIRSRLTEAGG